MAYYVITKKTKSILFKKMRLFSAQPLDFLTYLKFRRHFASRVAY